MNAATFANSKRLQNVLGVLADHRKHSTLDILTNARVCAVNSCISELRAAGFDIRCQRRGGIWTYQWVSEPQEIAA